MKLPYSSSHEDQIKHLNKGLKDCRIISFSAPTRPEHIFCMTVQHPDGQQQTIEVGATDLGWWLESPRIKGQHRLRDREVRKNSDFKSKDTMTVTQCDECFMMTDDEGFDPEHCVPEGIWE